MKYLTKALLLNITLEKLNLSENDLRSQGIEYLALAGVNLRSLNLYGTLGGLGENLYCNYEEHFPSCFDATTGREKITTKCIHDVRRNKYLIRMDLVKRSSSHTLVEKLRAFSEIENRNLELWGKRMK